ncbi:MAG TPA: cupin domain-containing protein [Kofleriaceae bacterium]|jgi:uncharacterized cupin superfamily protein
MAHPNVVHSAEVAVNVMSRGGFESKAHRLGTAAHGTTLGVSLYEVPPGKTAAPYHYHSGCEEGVYILDGEGMLRIGTESTPVRAGDYVAFPPGPEYAHQLTNSGGGPLRYLAMSAPAVHLGMDVVGYPDSNKLACFSGVKPGTSAWRDGSWVLKLVKADTPNCDYFDDEPLAK